MTDRQRKEREERQIGRLTGRKDSAGVYGLICNPDNVAKTVRERELRGKIST